MRSVAEDSMQAAWTGYLREAAAGYGAALPEDDRAEHLFESLACFCRQRMATGGAMPLDCTPLLLARVLHCTGQSAAARRVLEASQTRAGPAWRRLIDADEVTASLWMFIAARIVRAGEWVSLDDEPVWILDLNRLAISRQERHEIIFLKTLRLLLEKLTPLWAVASGAGVLGVKGVRRPEFEVWEQGRFPERLEGYMKDVLMREAALRGWRHVPQVRRIDL